MQYWVRNAFWSASETLTASAAPAGLPTVALAEVDGAEGAVRAGRPDCCAESESTPHMIATAPAINDRFNMNRLLRGRTAPEAGALARITSRTRSHPPKTCGLNRIPERTR